VGPPSDRAELGLKLFSKTPLGALVALCAVSDVVALLTGPEICAGSIGAVLVTVADRFPAVMLDAATDPALRA
jgi:hypothetical protein